MGCRFCTWWSERMCPEGLWTQSSRWEQDASYEWELSADEDDETRERKRKANEMFETDPALALEMHRELAEGGSAFAMRCVGWQYSQGRGVKRDLAAAEHWYYQALLAGSWLATLELASLLHKHRINQRWEGILENGVESGFVPANFWLAWYRYKRRPRRSTARQVRPLMEQAAQAGHPGARAVLARWKLLGKFGLRAVREGWREYQAVMKEYPCDGPEELAAAEA